MHALNAVLTTRGALVSISLVCAWIPPKISLHTRQFCVVESQILPDQLLGRPGLVGDGLTI